MYAQVHQVTWSFGALLAHPGLRGDGLRAQLAVLWEAVVPTKSNHREAIDCGMEKHRRRRCVENFFCRIKNFRRIATRYDQTEFELHGDNPQRGHLARTGTIVNAP